MNDKNRCRTDEPLTFLLLYLQIVRFVVQQKENEEKLREDIKGWRRELKEINMVDEFAKYAKTERKINKASDTLSKYSKSILALNRLCRCH